MVFSKHIPCSRCGTTFEFCGFSDRVRFSEYDQICESCKDKQHQAAKKDMGKLKKRLRG